MWVKAKDGRAIIKYSVSSIVYYTYDVIIIIANICWTHTSDTIFTYYIINSFNAHYSPWNRFYYYSQLTVAQRGNSQGEIAGNGRARTYTLDAILLHRLSWPYRLSTSLLSSLKSIAGLMAISTTPDPGWGLLVHRGGSVGRTCRACIISICQCFVTGKSVATHSGPYSTFN